MAEPNLTDAGSYLALVDVRVRKAGDQQGSAMSQLVAGHASPPGEAKRQVQARRLQLWHSPYRGASLC